MCIFGLHRYTYGPVVEEKLPQHFNATFKVQQAVCACCGKAKFFKVK